MVASTMAAQGEAVLPAPWVAWAWRAWHALTDDRHWQGGGMGPARPGRIPWSVVTAYADRHGHPLDLLLPLIRAMDGVYLDWCGERAARAADAQEGE